MIIQMEYSMQSFTFRGLTLELSFSMALQRQRSEIQDLSSTGTKDKLNVDDIFFNEYTIYHEDIVTTLDLLLSGLSLMYREMGMAQNFGIIQNAKLLIFRYWYGDFGGYPQPYIHPRLCSGIVWDRGLSSAVVVQYIPAAHLHNYAIFLVINHIPYIYCNSVLNMF